MAIILSCNTCHAPGELSALGGVRLARCAFRLMPTLPATYRFRIRAGGREITTVVDPDLGTSFYEDLRLLRWKSVGIRKTGEAMPLATSAGWKISLQACRSSGAEIDLAEGKKTSAATWLMTAREKFAEGQD